VIGPPLKVDLVVGGVGRRGGEGGPVVRSRSPCASDLFIWKLTGYPVGLLINFNVTLLKHGIRKVVLPDVYRRKSPVSPISPV
jgi:hypothetical protein